MLILISSLSNMKIYKQNIVISLIYIILYYLNCWVLFSDELLFTLQYFLVYILYKIWFIDLELFFCGIFKENIIVDKVVYSAVLININSWQESMEKVNTLYTVRNIISGFY